LIVFRELSGSLVEDVQEAVAGEPVSSTQSHGGSLTGCPRWAGDRTSDAPVLAAALELAKASRAPDLRQHGFDNPMLAVALFETKRV
jgi:hypothetical protein